MQNMLTEIYHQLFPRMIFSHLFQVWPFVLLEPQYDVLGEHF